jgi:RHS repeat-associated protein
MKLVTDIDRERSLDAMCCAYLASNSVAENLANNQTSVVRAFLNARYYNSAQGQFLSEDPVFLGDPKSQVLTDPQSLNSYSYANDNPIVKSDPTGRIAGIDDAISFGVGGLINLGIYGAGSRSSSQSMTWGGAFGAFLTGGIMGVAIDNAPETGGSSIAATVAAMKYAGQVGAGAGFLGNALQQSIDVRNGAQSGGLNWPALALSPVQSATSAAFFEGTLPSASIPMLSSGRNSFNAIGKSIRTQFNNGTIQNMSISTAFKSVIGSQAAGTFKTAGGAAWDIGSSRAANASVNSVSTWMGSFNPFSPQR